MRERGQLSILNILRELCVTLLRATFSLTYVASTDTERSGEIVGEQGGTLDWCRRARAPQRREGSQETPEG